MDLSEIGDLIKKRRAQLRLRQEDLSEMSEVNMKTIQQIESGKGNPSYFTLIKVLQVLGLEINLQIRQIE